MPHFNIAACCKSDSRPGPAGELHRGFAEVPARAWTASGDSPRAFHRRLVEFDVLLGASGPGPILRMPVSIDWRHMFGPAIGVARTQERLAQGDRAVFLEAKPFDCPTSAGWSWASVIVSAKPPVARTTGTVP